MSPCVERKERGREEEFEDSITKGTNNRKSVFTRFEKLNSLLEEIKNV